jgi:hypothetical protein
MNVQTVSAKVVAPRDIAVILLMTAPSKGADGPGIQDFSPHVTRVVIVEIGLTRTTPWTMDADGPSSSLNG